MSRQESDQNHELARGHHEARKMMTESGSRITFSNRIPCATFESIDGGRSWIILGHGRVQICENEGQREVFFETQNGNISKKRRELRLNLESSKRFILFDGDSDIGAGISFRGSQCVALMDSTQSLFCFSFKSIHFSNLFSTGLERTASKPQQYISLRQMNKACLIIPSLYFALFADFLNFANRKSLCLVNLDISKIVLRKMPVDLSHRSLSLECLNRIQRPITGFRVPLNVQSPHELSTLWRSDPLIVNVFVWEHKNAESDAEVPVELSEIDAMGLFGLVKLECSNNSSIHGNLRDLNRLNKLQILSLSGCPGIFGELNSLNSMTALTSLNLSSLDFVTGRLNSLIRLQRLKRLSLNNCERVSMDLHSLANCDLLECFQASFGNTSNVVLGSIAEFHSLVNLLVLDISNNALITGELGSLSRLLKLEFLSLRGCLLIRGNISTLSQITTMKHLDLQGLIAITGRVSALLDMKNLEYLNIQFCRKLVSPACFCVCRSRRDFASSIKMMRIFRIPRARPPAIWCDFLGEILLISMMFASLVLLFWFIVAVILSIVNQSW